MSEVKILGHLISPDGVAVDPSKIEVVIVWPCPMIVHEIKSLLGLVGYYRRFVEGFSKLSGSLKTLTKMNTRFNWTKKCKKSFLELKRRFTTTLVLALPMPHKPMVVFSNGSKFALRCFLIQEGQAVAYAFRQLKDQEKNYPMHGLELAAVFFDLKIWGHYLYGEACEIYTDHKNLQYISS